MSIFCAPSRTLSQPPSPSQSGYCNRTTAMASTPVSPCLRIRATNRVALRSAALAERIASRVARRVAEFFLDAQQLVVLRHAIGTRQRAGLDLARIGGHRQIGNRGVLGLARAVRNHRRIARSEERRVGKE